MEQGASLLDVLSYVNPVSIGIIFIYGALLGSFLNVVVYRMPLERSIVYPGSACGTCGTPLQWWENLPIISYLLLRGRCHTCGSTFSCRYAVVEALAGTAAAYGYYHYNADLLLTLYSFVFFCFLLVAFLMDLDHWIVLDSISMSGMVVGLAGALFMPQLLAGSLVDPLSVICQECGFFEGAAWPSWAVNALTSLVGMALGAGFFWAIQVVGTLIARQEALGSGDIKLAALIGAFLGWQYGLAAFFLSFIIGAAFAIVLMVSGRKRGADPIPLGTFMTLAAYIVSLWGDPIVSFMANWPAYFNGSL